MKFPVLRFIHYCLWIVGVAGGILIFLSPVLVYLFALRDLPIGSSTSADLVRLLPNLLLSGLSGVVFAVPVIALAELIALGLAIESHLSHLSVSRRTNEQTVLLLERIANRNSRPASAVAPAKPAAAPAARPVASPAKPTPAPSAPPPILAASAVIASPPPQPEPSAPAPQPEPPAPATEPEAPVPDPPTEAFAPSEPETTLSADVTAQNAFVFERPDVRSRYLGSAKPGRTLKLYGRDESGQWLSADATGTKWIQASHVKVDGESSALPVITPPAS